MSARIIYNPIHKTDFHQRAAKMLVNALEDEIKKQSGNVLSAEIRYTSVGHGNCPFGSGASQNSYIDFEIRVGKVKFCGLGEKDLEDIIECLKAELSGFSFESEAIYLYCGSTSIKLSAPKEVCYFAPPCKEFNALNAFIKKRTNKSIDLKKWYDVHLFGKRGRYDEHGSKIYHCYNAKKCQHILDTIKPKSTTKDTTTIEIVEFDDIDTEYSERYETECYGTRYNRLSVDIKTPTKKTKLKVTL